MSQSRRSYGSAASAGPSRIPTYVASAPRKSSSSFSPSQAASHGGFTPRRSNGPRKSSAFEAFDAPAYCDKMAAFIAEQLSNKSPRVRKQEPGVGQTSHDGWRGSDARHFPTTPGNTSRLADVSVQTAVGGADADAESSEGGEEANENQDDIDFARTRKTREAAQAFLQQVQGQSADLTEAEKSLEEQALALFGGAAADGQGEIATEADTAEDDDIQPEVAAQIAGMLAEGKKSSSARPLIEVMGDAGSDEESGDEEGEEEGESDDSSDEESEEGEEEDDEEGQEDDDDEEEIIEEGHDNPIQVPKSSYETDELADEDDEDAEEEEDGAEDGADEYLDGSMEDEDEEAEDEDGEGNLDIYTNGGSLYLEPFQASMPDEPIELLDSSDEEAGGEGDEQPDEYAEEPQEDDGEYQHDEEEEYQQNEEAQPHLDSTMDESVPISANMFEQTATSLDPSAWMNSIVSGQASHSQQDSDQMASLFSDAIAASQAGPVSPVNAEASGLEGRENSPLVDVPPPPQDLQQGMTSGAQLLSLKKHINLDLPDASRPASVTVQPGTPHRANSPPVNVPSPAQDLQQGMTSGAQLLSLKRHIDIALPDAPKPPSLAVQPGTPQRVNSAEVVRRADDGTARHARDLFEIKSVVNEAAGGTASMGTSLVSDVDTVPLGTDGGQAAANNEVQDDQLTSVEKDDANDEILEPQEVADLEPTASGSDHAVADGVTAEASDVEEHVQDQQPVEVGGDADDKLGVSDTLLQEEEDRTNERDEKVDEVEEEMIDYEEARGVDANAAVVDGMPDAGEEEEKDDDEGEAEEEAEKEEKDEESAEEAEEKEKEAEEEEKDEEGAEVKEKEMVADEDDLIAEAPAPDVDTDVQPEEQVGETGTKGSGGEESQAIQDGPPEEEEAEEEEPAKPRTRRSTRGRTTSTQEASLSPVITRRSLRSATPRATSEAPSETSRSAKKKRRSPRKSDAGGDLADYVPDDVIEEEEESGSHRRAKRARTEEKQEEVALPQEEEEAGVFDTSILEEEADEPMEVDEPVEEEKAEVAEGEGEKQGDAKDAKKRKRAPRKSGPRKSADPSFRVTRVEESESDEDEEAVEKKRKKEEAAKAKKEADREKRRILREAKKQEKEEEQKEAKEAERAAAGVIRGKRRVSEDAKTFKPEKEGDEGEEEVDEEEEETSATRKTRPRRSRRKASQTPQ